MEPLGCSRKPNSGLNTRLSVSDMKRARDMCVQGLASAHCSRSLPQGHGSSSRCSHPCFQERQRGQWRPSPLPPPPWPTLPRPNWSELATWLPSCKGAWKVGARDTVNPLSPSPFLSLSPTLMRFCFQWPCLHLGLLSGLSMGSCGHVACRWKPEVPKGLAWVGIGEPRSLPHLGLTGKCLTRRGSPGTR